MKNMRHSKPNITEIRIMRNMRHSKPNITEIRIIIKWETWDTANPT